MISSIPYVTYQKDCNSLIENRFIQYANSNYYTKHENKLRELLNSFDITEIPKHYHMTYSNFDDLTDVLKKHIMNTKIEFEKAGWKFSFYNKKQRELFIKQNFKRRVYESYKRINP